MVPGKHIEGSRKLSKRCDLGMFQTSKNKLPCWREHDFEVVSNSRKTVFFVLFWTLILELLGSPIEESELSRDAWISFERGIDFRWNLHPKSTQNHVKSMLRPILGRDGTNKRSFIDFASNFHGFLIDFDVISVRYSNHVAFNFHSIWDWLRWWWWWWWRWRRSSSEPQCW